MNAKVLNITEINFAICEALGLNPKDVLSVDIEIRGGKLPVVKVQHLPEIEALKFIAKLVRN